ncbi:hypothetical protein [Devosia sp.]|uniref:hypothetical protein n=1 Tax=Devosia sp. TaxID=1871048 RepID=UPI003BAB77A6
MAASTLRKITYFCPPEPKPSGGINYLLRHSRLVNELSGGEVQSDIFFIGPFASPPLFSREGLSIKTDNVFNRFTDLVVIPEVIAPTWAPLAAQQGVRYAIMVQNGYYIFNNFPPNVQVPPVYEGAVAVLSTSNLINETIAKVIPSVADKISYVNYSIDPNIFAPSAQKSDIVSYMPRKLPYDSGLVIRHLMARNLKGFKFVQIDGLDQQGVAKLLGSSKIFMSFSNFEGFGLPPVEAAMAGNKVIGYTGQGGREYWKQPLFEEIHAGDIMAFADAIEREVLHQIAHPDANAEAFQQPIADLAARYSVANERKNLTAFVTKMAVLFAKGI